MGVSPHADPEFYEKYQFCRNNKAGDWCDECERLDQEAMKNGVDVALEMLRLAPLVLAAAIAGESENRD